MRQITKKQVWVHDNWIHVDGVGRIGLYAIDRKEIQLDYSMKWIVGSNEAIPCTKTEIEDKIFELFNGKDSGVDENMSTQNKVI
jgi:hypothetical protein